VRDPSRDTIGGRYALCGEIAAGGMATVHLARQLGAAGFARIVAIKRLHERYARDPDFVAMLLDEARIVARIHHPNVVQTIDVVAEAGELFLVMEYVHGESLLRLMRATQKKGALLPVPVIAAILVATLHGLHAAHEARSESGEALGIVHRDVSPHNILVGGDGIARVLDFGVARASERIHTTHEGQLKGKLSYMAPEQITNQGVDRRTDVYATAVCLWEALTGTKLFEGGSEGAILEKILRAPPRPPTTLNTSIPRALEAVVLCGLAREPGERFATARDMALAIERATRVATATEISAVVSAVCHENLSQRARLISTIEMSSSSSNLNAAVDSLRMLASGRTEPASKGAELPTGASQERNGGVTPDPSLRGPESTRVIAIVAAIVPILALGAWALFARRKVVPEVVVATSVTLPTPGSRCPDGMVLVPGGRFFMGSDDDLPAERPAHKVTLRAYCMDKREVTTAEYRACSDRGDCKRAPTTNTWDGITATESKVYDPVCNGQDPSRDRHPINCVDWYAADRFCHAEGKRLPTEAEWEFAARGSDGRKYPWGDAPPSVKHLNACGAECVAWGRKRGVALEALFATSDPWPTTAPVGSFPEGASRWGIDDIAGNVWEWTADYYALYTADDIADPVGPASGTSRVIRGGGWNGAYADWVRPSFRFHQSANTRSHGTGFRCAKTP
jgi:eukaryotic-like serine/threonine-protein kinase